MLHPFRALRFSAEAGRLADLVTQPYDKISPEAKAAYEARSPHSIVRIIRGESGPDDLTWHPQAAARLQAWKDQGLLVPDDAPAFYVYRQTFTTPDGQRHERTGVTGVLDLSQRSRVLHHERTHGKARSDRLKLLEATGVHFGQIFLLRHEGPKFDPSWLATTTDETTVEEPDGTVHRFARLNDESAAEKLERVFADSGFVIADGHHRFTVAGDYADAHPDRPGASRVMVTVVDVEDEGLVVLPTHRVLRDLPAERTRGILPFFQAVGAEPFALLDDPTPFLEEVRRAGPGTIGVASRAGAYLWKLDLRGREGVDALDVRRLDEDIIQPMTRELNLEDHLSYHRDPTAAVRRARDGGSDLAFILNPVTARQTCDIASGGGVMPPKSTDFFPKMLTGFVLYDTNQG